jgi:hypothetical protein
LGGARPGSLVLISDLLQDGWMEGIGALAGRGFEVSVIHVLAPAEADPDLSGDLKLVDLEGLPPVEITADYDVLSRYRQELERWREGLRRYCSARGILYIPLTTAMPLDTLLFAFLERQGVLK